MFKLEEYLSDKSMWQGSRKCTLKEILLSESSPKTDCHATMKILLEKEQETIRTCFSCQCPKAMSGDGIEKLRVKMDGGEATKALRELDIPYCKTVPIVALTANAVYGAREELLSSGFTDYVAKPIEMKQLEDVLKKYLVKGEAIETVAEEEISEKVAPTNMGWEMLEAEGIECHKAMKKMQLSEDSYCDILHNYYRDLIAAKERLTQFYQKDKRKEFVIDVHGIKSSSASVGAKNLSEFAKGLEAAGKRDDKKYVEEHIDAFNALCDRLILSLKNFFKESDFATGEPEEAVSIAPTTDCSASML